MLGKQTGIIWNYLHFEADRVKDEISVNQQWGLGCLWMKEDLAKSIGIFKELETVKEFFRGTPHKSLRLSSPFLHNRIQAYSKYRTLVRTAH